jgi:hypothetical protein
VLGEIVVAAGEGGDDLDAFEQGLETAARPDRTLDSCRRGLGRLFAAEPGEELVQVVDRSHHVVAVSAS